MSHFQRYLLVCIRCSLNCKWTLSCIIMLVFHEYLSQLAFLFFISILLDLPPIFSRLYLLFLRQYFYFCSIILLFLLAYLSFLFECLLLSQSPLLALIAFLPFIVFLLITLLIFCLGKFLINLSII